MAQDTILSSVGAAQWVAKFYKGRSHTLRQLAAVAGKVTTHDQVEADELIAAWVYRPCEDQVRDATDQACIIADIEAHFGSGVAQIVRSLVIPPNGTEEQSFQQFKASTPAAKRIRIAEVLVGLEASFIMMYGGAMAKIDDVRHILKFARFVYENSREVSRELRQELLSLIVGVENMWNAIMSTMESFEKTIGAPDMIPVKLIAVANDLGTVRVATFDGEPLQANVRKAFDALRAEIGGSLFTETLLHATVPLPKVDVIKPVPTPSPDPTAPAS